MRVNELFPPEYIEEDIRKMLGGAALGAALMAAPDVAKAPNLPSENISRREAQVLAQTIWGEARSHGREGMTAVGHVILNRAQAERPRLFGDGVEGVATKNKQFSCWNNGDPNRDRMQEMVKLDDQIRRGISPDGTPFQDWYQNFLQTGEGREYKAWLEAKRIARSILAGRSADPTEGALFYHTTAVTPKWSKRMTPSGQIANHIFYRGPDA